MKSVSVASRRHLETTRKPRTLDVFARRLVLEKLGQIKVGRISVTDGLQSWNFGQSEHEAELKASIVVRHPAFYSDIAFGGSIGAGEAYMDGHWKCSDLVSLVRILLRNRPVLEGMESGAARLTMPLQKAFHWVNRNTRSGAQRNIAAHYDLGNEFFALWLDESMMYSSAIYERPDMSLAEAQTARLGQICDKLALRPGDRVVEIGTGWGGFAVHAAKKYGCHVTTTTISREQFDLARKRIDAAGVADRVELLLQDYRDLRGSYDKLVSIEMIEAIGWKQFDTYFKKCSDLLKPGGEMLIQAITIADQQFERAKRSVDFIQRYIFPGSNLTSVASMSQSIASQTDLQFTALEDIGPDYARTLRDWRRNFLLKLPEVRALGYPEAFIRMWEYYLCYCEGGFMERAISDVHLQARKPAY